MMMETTPYGELDGYTHHEVKATGSNLQLASIQFYEKLSELIDGKEIVFRLTPRAYKYEDEFTFRARVHIKN